MTNVILSQHGSIGNSLKPTPMPFCDTIPGKPSFGCSELQIEVIPMRSKY